MDYGDIPTKYRCETVIVVYLCYSMCFQSITTYTNLIDAKIGITFHPIKQSKLWNKRSVQNKYGVLIWNSKVLSTTLCSSMSTNNKMSRKITYFTFWFHWKLVLISLIFYSFLLFINTWLQINFVWGNNKT